MPDTAQQCAVRNNGGDVVQLFGPSRDLEEFITHGFVRVRWMALTM